jgi:hypothetical protein
MSTQDSSLVTAVVDGQPLGVFDSRSGGEVDSEVSKRYVGGQRVQQIYKGLRATGDVTITRGYERERDHELARTLEQRAGLAPMSVSEQPLDDEGNPWGKPKTWTGKLKSVNTGDYDAQSGEPRIIEFVMVAQDVA